MREGQGGRAVLSMKLHSSHLRRETMVILLKHRNQRLNVRKVSHVRHHALALTQNAQRKNKIRKFRPSQSSPFSNLCSQRLISMSSACDVQQVTPLVSLSSAFVFGRTRNEMKRNCDESTRKHTNGKKIKKGKRAFKIRKNEPCIV